MKNIIFVFVLTFFLTMSGNVLAHCGNAEAHAKASDHQSHDDTKDKKDKDKDKGLITINLKKAIAVCNGFFFGEFYEVQKYGRVKKRVRSS